MINDFEYIIDVAPILKNGRTFLPLRHLSEVLNFLVTWVEKDREIIIEGYVDENNDRIIFYKNNINNIIRHLIFNKSNEVILSNDIDINFLIKYNKEFLIRNIKIYLTNDINLYDLRQKFLSLNGIFINENNSYYIYKDNNLINIFNSTDSYPKDALLKFADFRFKEKNKYYILVSDKFYIEIFKPYIYKDVNFLGFILIENN